MKYNIIRYLKTYGSLSFQEKPFSPEDALALTILSYLKMSGLVSGFGAKTAVGITELAKHPEAEKMFSDPIYGNDQKRVFMLMAESRRFRRVRLQNYVEWSDGDREVQFAAVTLLLGRTSTFVAYRGTDDTLNGWKEDFNMGFLPTIPSQRRAVSYLLRTAASVRGAIIVAGHSKGGNLALYAAAFSPEPIQRRIRRIYNFDGPGMQAACKGYHRIQRKYYKIVPEESVIGMVFQYDSDYHVVRSYRRGLMQHDVLQWYIRGEHFSYVTGIRKKYRYLAHILNRWISSLSTDQISSFVEILYQLVCAARVKTVYELIRRPFHAWYLFHTEFFHLERNQRKTMKFVLHRLFMTPFLLLKERHA